MSIATTHITPYVAGKILPRFVGRSQWHAMCHAARGEEGEWFKSKMAEMTAIIAAMPRTYATDGQGDSAIVGMHYFTGGCDWFIVELDREEEQHQAYGLANIGHGGEKGYISIVEIIAAGAELDLHWTPITLAQVRASRQ